MMRLSLLCTALLLAPTSVPAQNPQPSASQTEEMCGLQTYQDSLDLAFRQATAGHGEALVTLQVLPSFQREYAIVVKREGSELKLFRAIFREKLSRQLRLMEVRKTRQECLDQAQAAEMETAVLPATPEQVNRLWNQFTNTSLESDTCTRRHGKCIFGIDGTGYVIQTANGRSIRLTETGRGKDVRSENPALLDWVHKVIQVARDSQHSER